MFWPIAMIAPIRVEAMPVSVSVPMTMPTMAQAMPTGSAFFAPSASEFDADDQRLAPALENEAGGDQRTDDQRQNVDAEAHEGRGGEAERDPEHDAEGERADQRGERRAKNEHDGECKAHRAGEDRRVAGKEQIDQRGERQDERPVLLHRGPGVRQFVLAHAAQPRLAGFEMDLPETGAEIEQRRDDRGLHHVGIGDVQRLGHDEGDGAHHRRHDLPAHRRGRLDAAGESRLEAEALHQRDGELAAGHDVGDPRAGDGAHQCRRQHADLRRPTAPGADQTQRHVVEERDHAGAFEEGGKDHEDEDVGGRDVDRRAVDALRAKGEILDDLDEVVAAVDQRRRQVTTEEAVGEEDAGDDGERPTHQPARGFEHQHKEHDANDDVGRRQEPAAMKQWRVFDPVVDAGREAENAEGPEQDLPGRGLGAQRRQQSEAEQQQEADMHGPDDLARQEGVGCRDELEGREGDGDGKRQPATEPVAPAGRQTFDKLDVGAFPRRSHGRRPDYFRMPASL